MYFMFFSFPIIFIFTFVLIFFCIFYRRNRRNEIIRRQNIRRVVEPPQYPVLHFQPASPPPFYQDSGPPLPSLPAEPPAYQYYQPSAPSEIVVE